MGKGRLAIVFAAIAATGLVGGWYYVTGTPTYSLWILQRAIERNDLDRILRYVDIDAITEAVAEDTVPVAAEIAMRSVADEFGLTQADIDHLPNLDSQSALPMAAEKAAKHVHNALSSKGFEVDRQRIPFAGARIISMERDGALAMVVIGPDSTGGFAFGAPRIELTMRQSLDRSWRIVHIPTLSEWMNAAMVEAERKRVETDIAREKERAEKALARRLAREEARQKAEAKAAKEVEELVALANSIEYRRVEGKCVTDSAGKANRKTFSERYGAIWPLLTEDDLQIKLFNASNDLRNRPFNCP